MSNDGIDGCQPDVLADLAWAPLEPEERFQRIMDSARLCVELAGKLSRFLGFGWKWITGLVRLVIFTMVLWPGFLAMMLFYFLSARVRRDIPYGRKPRNLLDLYIPYRRWMRQGKVPVVVFITGGAWMIGYKAWGAILGRRLSQRGVLVACLDYRNFPQGRVPEMVEDVSTGIGWVLSQIHLYGGDRHQVYVVGQSCGGHLGLLALISQGEKLAELQSGGPVECSANGGGDSGPAPAARPRRARRLKWDPRRIQGFVALSSPFDIVGLQSHFRSRGLGRRLLNGIFASPASPDSCSLPPLASAGPCISMSWSSPIERLKAAPPTVLDTLPSTLLLHGTKDVTVPHTESIKLHDMLKHMGVSVQCKLYDGCTHTSPLIERPMAGGRDVLIEDVLMMVKKGAVDGYASRPLPILPFPRILSFLAGLACPF